MSGDGNTSENDEDRPPVMVPDALRKEQERQRARRLRSQMIAAGIIRPNGTTDPETGATVDGEWIRSLPCLRIESSAAR